MGWFSRSMIGAIGWALVAGCSSSIDHSQPSFEKYRFLGIVEDETSNEGPVGLMGGQSTQVSSVSKVREVPYLEYELAKEGLQVVAEDEHNGFVYWAVKEEREVHFENATAWLTVLERFKSRIE